jgi:hypothetical protein
LDLWIKSYGCLKFQGEVWAGQACAAANEKELTTYAKKGGRKKKKFKKNGNSPISPGVDPWLVGDRWFLAGPGPPTCGRRPRRSAAQGHRATRGRSPATGRYLRLSGYPNFCEIFLFKKK